MVSVHLARPSIRHRTEVISIEFNPDAESPTAFCKRMIAEAKTAMGDWQQDFLAAGGRLGAAEKVAKEHNLGTILEQIRRDERTLESTSRVTASMYPQS